MRESTPDHQLREPTLVDSINLNMKNSFSACQSMQVFTLEVGYPLFHQWNSLPLSMLINLCQPMDNFSNVLSNSEQSNRKAVKFGEDGFIYLISSGLLFGSVDDP